MVKICNSIVVLVFFVSIQVNLIATPNNRGKLLKSNFPLVVYQQYTDSLEIKLGKIKRLFNEKEYSKSLELGLELLGQINEQQPNLKFNCLTIIGDVFRENNNYPKALSYYLQALKIDNRELPADILHEYLNKGDELNLLLKIGIIYQKEAKKDSAIFFYKKIVENEFLENKNFEIKAHAYNNLAGLYLYDSLYDHAKEYVLKTIRIYKKNKDVVLQAASLGTLASIYLEQKNFKKAKEIYFEALELIKNDKGEVAVKFKEDLYLNIGWTLYLMKDYMGFHYQKQSYDIKEYFRDKEMRKLVEDIHAKYELSFEEQKTIRSKAELEIQKLKERNAVLIFSVLSIAVLIISIAVFYYFKQRQNNLKLRFVQAKLEQQHQLEKVRNDAQNRILNATLDGKESERKQIAETLHDSVSALLSSANMHLQASKNQFDTPVPMEIVKTQKIITEASEKIRDLSHALVSSVLLKFGLKYAITEIAEKYSNSKIQFNAQIDLSRRYHQKFEIKVNNIVEELINNILKHSDATEANIYLQEDENILKISIEDDGKGFDISKGIEKDGIGLNQINARIKVMKGYFNIDSVINNGTKITIKLPIIERENS